MAGEDEQISVGSTGRHLGKLGSMCGEVDSQGWTLNWMALRSKRSAESSKVKRSELSIFSVGVFVLPARVYMGYIYIYIYIIV